MFDIENSEELEKTSAENAPDDNAERQKRTPYHAATFGVLSCLFHKYKKNGNIELIDEQRLSKEPLRIDIVVLKKNRDIELKPVWAKVFRGHNIIEYKSPVDKTPSLAVFYKLIGYAMIYAAQNEVEISDVTATLICARTPQKLFKILKENFDYKILEKDASIYYIIKKGVAVEKSLVVQVMVQKSEPLLQALDRRPMDGTTVDKVVKRILAIGKKERELLGYWLKALTFENATNISERMRGDMEKEKALMEIMNSLGFSERLRQESMQKGIQKGRQEGIQKGRQEGALEAIALLEKGYSLTEAKKKLRLTGTAGALKKVSKPAKKRVR